jgi:HEAT repeat protein
MKRSRGLLLAASGGVAVVAVFQLWTFFAQPKYQGQGLNVWMMHLQRENQEERAMAQTALRTMGKSAVPPLTGMLEKEDSAFKRKVLAYAPRFPFLYWFVPQDDSVLDRGYAASALGEIGPGASNAVPALLRVSALTNSQINRTFICPKAKAALMKIRGEPLGPLVRELEQENAGSVEWGCTARELLEFGTNALPAVPAFCGALKLPNFRARNFAAYALGHIHGNAELAVPALVESIRRGVSENNAWALGEFGGEAKPAVPILESHLQDSDPRMCVEILRALRRIVPRNEAKTLVPMLVETMKDQSEIVRAEAGNMLKDIDPEAAAKAGVK